MALESSPRGWYLVGIVKTSRKIHEQPWGLMTIVTTDLYTSSTQIAYIFSFIMLMCLWKIPQIPIYPCHTLYTRGRYGVLVRDMYRVMRHGILPQEWGLVPLGTMLLIRACPLLQACENELPVFMTDVYKLSCRWK